MTLYYDYFLCHTYFPKYDKPLRMSDCFCMELRMSNHVFHTKLSSAKSFPPHEQESGAHDPKHGSRSYKKGRQNCWDSLQWSIFHSKARWAPKVVVLPASMGLLACTNYTTLVVFWASMALWSLASVSCFCSSGWCSFFWPAHLLGARPSLSICFLG